MESVAKRSSSGVEVHAARVPSEGSRITTALEEG
jgi:hypothetical protein